METIIKLILEKIDKDMLQVLLDDLRDADSTMDAIRNDVDEVKKNVSFWDRINVFTNTDSEIQLKEYKREYRDVRRAHKAILRDIKTLIREAIDRSLPVRMKIQMAEIDDRLLKLKIKRRLGAKHDPKRGRYEIDGIHEVQDSIGEMDLLICEAYGLEPGKVDVTMAVGAVYEHILGNAGFLGRTP